MASDDNAAASVSPTPADVSSMEAVPTADPNTTATVPPVQTISPLEMAFGKEHADKRKGFMVNYDIEDTLDSSLERVSVRDFVHKELNHFAVYDTQRSVPHVMDGLKPSQRKILYAAFKRNLVKEIKVAQTLICETGLEIMNTQCQELSLGRRKPGSIVNSIGE